MENIHSTLKATVRGYVQGVGFRVFVRSAAWKLNLRGYVKNMPDGTVHVLAWGTRDALEKLLAEIRKGPAGAEVTAIDVDWQQATPEALPASFEVRH